MVGDGNSFVVYNCTEPSYLDSYKNRIPLKGTLFDKNRVNLNTVVDKWNVRCDLPTNTWRIQSHYITFNPVKNRFAEIHDEGNIKYILELDQNLNNLKKMHIKINDSNELGTNEKMGLIPSLLRTFHHPRYYY